MAYEDMEYEVILERMIDSVSEQYPNLDTREGSIIYNALAPAALELAIMYVELDNVLNESFVETASREYLVRKCEEMGIDSTIFDATHGVHRGEFNTRVPIGTRWNCDLYNYEVIKYVDYDTEYYAYELKCETEGSEPNNIVGDLTPIDDIEHDGLTYARLVDCLIEGEAEGTDEQIKEFYFNYVKNSGLDGNITQYLNWCNAYPGIGNCKILPLWNGDNTVKVSILNSANGVASDELIAEFQEYLDPNAEGMGNGVAPIGAFVTVSTATEVPITVTAKVTLENGFTDPSIINAELVKYFQNIAYKQNIVSYIQLGAAILNLEGVALINDLKINGVTSDIILGDEEIAIFESATWTVVS